MAEVIDETGNKYGKWTVLYRAENTKAGKAKWICRCDCGTEHAVSANNLKTGDSKSCGCVYDNGGELLVDETGNKYGKLTVISRVKNNDIGKAQWLCKCDCGKNVVVVSSQLRLGKTKSCGCLRHTATALPNGESAFNNVYSRIKRRAIQIEKGWNLTKLDIRKITKQNCYYCGIEPSQESKEKRQNGSYIYNGLDRVDNTKGYTLDNVVPCCGRCNKAKNIYHKDNFLMWVEKVYKYSIGGTA